MDSHTTVDGELASVGTLAESVEKALKFGALLALAGLIVLGLAAKWGEDAGRVTGDRMRQQQGQPVLKPLPSSGTVELFWNDPATIQGGIRGVATMGVLCLYVVLMLTPDLLRGVPSRSVLIRRASVLTGYPISMAGVAVVALFYPVYRYTGPVPLAVAGLAIVAGIGTFFCFRHAVIQVILLGLQLMTLSYAIGLQRGVQSADFEQGHPLVEIQTVDGTTLSGLRMLSVGEDDLHLVSADGFEQLIPRARVRSARVVR